MANLKSTEPILFRERVVPNLGTFGAVAILFPAIVLVSEPFDLRIGLVIGPTVVVAIWAALYLFSPVIQVGKQFLSVGPATVPRTMIGKIIEIPKDQIFHERGPGLDPASFKMFQGTVRTALKITINDPLDPTPYWIVSTRRPTQLATVLAASL